MWFEPFSSSKVVACWFDFFTIHSRFYQSGVNVIKARLFPFFVLSYYFNIIDVASLYSQAAGSLFRFIRSSELTF